MENTNKNKKVELVNLTPHAITFVRESGEVITRVEPSGQLARVSSSIEKVGEVAGLPVTETKFGEVEGLPAAEDGKVFLVSSLVAQRVPEREDVFIPAESVRDSEGRIVGCKSLGRI